MIRPAILALLLALALPATAPAQGASTEAPWTAQRTAAGIALELELGGVPGGAAEGPVAHATARLRLDLHDTSGAPLDGAEPAAWMRRRHGNGPEACGEQVARYLSGDLFSRADVDWNVYYILTLNHDATISVVDPLFGFGGSRALALVLLESPGADWVLVEGATGGRLFVSQPEAGKVAVVRTDTWEVERQLEVGPGVGRLRLQDDGAFVWALYPGGLVALETSRGELAGELSLAAPGSDFVLGPEDATTAYVLEPALGGVEVLDLATRRSLGRVATGTAPRTLAASPLSGAVWVGHRDGRLAAVDLGPGGPRLRQQLDTGLAIHSLRFAPGGRLGFVLAPEANTLAILDTARGRIVQQGPMAGAPDQVNFSDELAYVRDRRSEQVLMVPLDTAGIEGTPLQAADFPGGSLPPSPSPLDPPVLAPSFARAPGASAMVVANPRDTAIYFYKEGMAAPMGHFTNQGRRPLAVLVVDRSLRGTGPGVYETFARLEGPGTYDLAVFLDAPRLVECFTVEVASEEATEEIAPPRLRLAAGGVELLPGGGVELELEGEARPGRPWPERLVLLANRVAGGWHRRLVAERVDGTDEVPRFKVRIVPGPPGEYLVWSEVGSPGPPLLRLRVPQRSTAPGAAP
jgi:hypothetical protein